MEDRSPQGDTEYVFLDWPRVLARAIGPEDPYRMMDPPSKAAKKSWLDQFAMIHLDPEAVRVQWHLEVKDFAATQTWRFWACAGHVL